MHDTHPAGFCHKLGGTFWGNSKQPQLQLGDLQRVVSMAAVVYDCPHNHGHKGVYLHVSLSMLNFNY